MTLRRAAETLERTKRFSAEIQGAGRAIQGDAPTLRTGGTVVFASFELERF